MASVQLIKEGLRKAAERGVFPGRKFYGETAEQRAVIETVVTLAIEKKRLRKIADYLNEKGIKTRLGRQWYPTQIKNILDREKEAGRIRKRRYAGIPYWERVEPESENGFEKNWYEI